MFVATLSACESSTGNQESAGGDTTTPQPETPKPADLPIGGDLIDHAIVGYWASTDFFTYSEIKTGKYAYSTQNAEGWVFERDGTFHFFLHTTGNRSFNGLSQRKGNYRIEDDKIYCTDVLESWKSYDNPERFHDFRPGNDFMLTYEFRDNGKAMGLNRSNLIGDYDPAVYLTHFHYIEEQQNPDEPPEAQKPDDPPSGGRTLGAAEKALVGTWIASYSQGTVRNAHDWSYLYAAGIGIGYSFHEDGTYSSFVITEGTTGMAMYIKGKWNADKNTIYMTDRTFQYSQDRGKTWSDWREPATPNITMDYYHGVNEDGRAFIDKPSDIDDRTGRLYKQVVTE